jgi:L-cysteine/cystine lyase
LTFAEVRALFPVLERLAYLNAGTMGPLARPTADAMAERARLDLEDGRGGRPYFEAMLAARTRVRERLAGLAQVDPATVALTTSTTDGCNIVLAGLDLKPDDEIVTTDVEHFGLLGPLHASGARVRVAAVRDRPATEAEGAILAEVGRRTRLLALSHVAWTTGHILPIDELKARTGLPILVDGAQSVGAIPVEAQPFDFYTISGQKWLCGPDSTGGLVVRDPEALRVARPSYFAQAGYEPTGRFTAREGAARFDPGWLSLPSLVGLEAALDAAPEWRYTGAAQAAARCRTLLSEVVEVVTEPGHATLVSFRAPGDSAEVAARLYDEGVVVRDMPGTGWVRASCGYWTSDEDLERLRDGLARMTA